MGEWRTLHIKLQRFTTLIFKSIHIRWTGHVLHMRNKMFMKFWLENIIRINLLRHKAQMGRHKPPSQRRRL
jgi:hypothetical protein